MFDNILQSEGKEGYGQNRQAPDLNVERMEAGYNSLFQVDGEDGIDTFWKIRQEREELGYSPSSEGLKSALHQEETDMINLGLQQTLVDPNVSLESKQLLAGMSVTDERIETPLPVKLGRELLMQDDETVGEPATDEQEDMRSLYIESLENQMEYREVQQSLINTRNFEESATGVSMTIDLAQMIIPFVEQSNVAEALAKVGDGSKSIGAFFALGEFKQQFFDSFKRMPLDERIKAAEMFIEVAREANTTAFVTNGLLEQQMVQELVYGGNYGTGDKWVDNVVSWFDMSVLGKPIAWAARGVQGATKTGKALKAIKAAGDQIRTDAAAHRLMAQMRMSTVRTEISPISPIRVASETNVERSRAMFNAVVSDTTEEAAGALGGASKAEVVADSVLPEIHFAEGVRAKVNLIDAHSVKADFVSADIRTALDASMVNALTRSEMASAAANEVNQLQDVVGLVSRNEMFQHSVTPTGAKIHGVYGTSKTGFASAEDAFEQTEMALRGHGIERSDMYLMQKSADTGEYVRVDEAVGNDFLVGVDFEYQARFSDVLQWDNLSVHKNFLDRVPLLAKHSINRNFFDPASMLDPHLTLGANARIDRTAQVTQDFLEVGKKFSDGFGKAGKESQASMYKYILEANEQQIPHNINTLRGEWGFSPKEIKTIEAFREYWDTVWEARNVTDVKALRNKGFGVYENNKGDRLFSRPVIKGQVSRNERTYNPATGMSEFLDEAQLEKLYEQGHTIAKMRRPQQLGGVVTDQMIVRNDSGWRALRDTDKVYPYREGYFQRMYKAPIFITKREVTSGGTEFERAIATADTMVDAKLYKKRLLAQDGKADFVIRDDVKDPRSQGEYEMDTFESSGMSSQYERGDKLIDSTAALRGTEDANVLSPVDAIIASSRSMGRKVGMGDFIEASKKRFMEQFKDQLEVERGMTKYPTRMEDIGAKGQSHSADAADARSTYEYISFLEYGYINGMDSVYKSVLKGIADIASGKGLRGVEVALSKAAELSPTSLAKNTAFQMYIAANPIRQAALNAHQSTLLTAKFSKYVASQRLAADMHAFMYLRMGMKMPKLAVKATGRTSSELKFMWKEYQKSGMSAAIDQQNMIRGSMMDMVESQRFKGDQGIIGGGLSLSRRVGFDVGEEININSAWLAHYDEATKSKKFLDASDFDRVAGNARNFTFNMNRAGDMPYNANSLALFFQFVQVPHKSLLQMSNRAISGVDRTKLGLYNATMFTLPPAAMYGWFGEILPDQEKFPEAHNAVVAGLQFHMFNKALELVTGETASVDFGNLAPSDAYGLYDFMRGMLTTEMAQIMANTPSGQLVAGGNPRITNLVNTIVSYVTPDDTQGMSPTTLSNVFNDLAALSSGMSNIFKAKMALEHGKAYGTRNQVIDPSVSTPEAIMLAFGFRTMESTQRAWVGYDLYEKSKAYTDDVNIWYKRLTRKLASEGSRADTDEYVVKVLSMSFLAFGNSEKAMGILQRNLDRDTLAGTGVIYDSILKRADYMSTEEMMTWSNAVPDDGSGSKEALRETVEFIRQYKEER